MSTESDPHLAPTSVEALDALVAAFEDSTLPKSRWTHEAHLAVGAHYVFRLGEDAAMDAMRKRVRFYNEAVGTANTATSGYHETLTRMWISTIARLLEHSTGTSRLAFMHSAVARLGPRRSLHMLLYDFDVVKDSHARAHWVSPGHPLPAGIVDEG
jgi:hypothetical protein